MLIPPRDLEGKGPLSGRVVGDDQYFPVLLLITQDILQESVLICVAAELASSLAHHSFGGGTIVEMQYTCVAQATSLEMSRSPHACPVTSMRAHVHSYHSTSHQLGTSNQPAVYDPPQSETSRLLSQYSGAQKGSCWLAGYQPCMQCWLSVD